jgi:polysaccharide export outer membrane protein
VAPFASAADRIYYIGSGDVLEISVWKDESLSRKLVVPPDGVVSFPLIGDIEVSSMTVTDLRKAVTKRLSEYIPDPTVTVMLVEINSLKAYVIGRVNNPGEFPINMETSVTQVLSMAGGLNPFASGDKVHILRREKNTTVKIPVDYELLLKGKNLEQNILLKKGDVVVVP